MKTILFGLACLLTLKIHAFDYEPLFENDQICVAHAKIQSNEEIGLHRDAYPQIIIALKGGTITRLEEDGRITDVQFPTGVAVARNPDPENQLHRSVNKSSQPIELMIFQLKDNPPIVKKDEGTHEVDLKVKISCPPSDEFQQFLKSIPRAGNYSTSFPEWKSSFINNMRQLIHLVESEKISNPWWSVKTDAESLEEHP
jgi:hypothetical protein